MIRVRNLYKSSGSLQVLEGVGAKIKKGECVCVIRSSGSGESTFLRCLNLLGQPDSGEISTDGVDVMGAKRDMDKLCLDVDMVFRYFNLFSHLTIMESLMLAPLELKLITEEEADAEAKTLLERVGVGDKTDSYPDKLSGGQKRCAAIARALTLPPKVMLSDEPIPVLDPEMVGKVLEVMKQLANEGMTMIMVTHEMGFTREIGDWVYLMDEDVALRSGTPKNIFENPQNGRTGSFLSEVL